MKRHGSALVVLVVASPPHAGLIPPLGCAVEPLVHAPETVPSARIGGIRVEGRAVLERERANAGSLARVRGYVRAGRGCVGGDGVILHVSRHPRVGARLPRRLAPIVVFDAPLALLLLGEAHTEIGIEVAAE